MKTTMNPYVFAVGCPRSGTTLLQRMLDAHPDLAVANDSHFIPKAIKGLSPSEDLALTPEIVENARTYRRFHRLGLPDGAVEKAAEDSKTYPEFVGALYTEYASMRGKVLGGEKTPDYAKEIPTLHALFPRARFVHIIRDGRDVALSVLKWANESKGPGKLELWSEEPVAVCAMWWKWQVEMGLRDGRGIGAGRYLEVHYEDLVAEPEERLRKIAAFLDLAYSARMINFHEGKTRDDPGLDAKKAWLPATKGLRDWRSELSERDLELFEALAGDLLSELGYERSVGDPSPEIEDVAARCRAWWEADRSKRREERRLSGDRGA